MFDRYHKVCKLQFSMEIMEGFVCHTMYLSLFNRYFNFLTEKFEVGLKYHSLNCYPSALSSALIPADGFQVGQHPLVVRLMKGVFQQ